MKSFRLNILGIYGLLDLEEGRHPILIRGDQFGRISIPDFAYTVLAEAGEMVIDII